METGSVLILGTLLFAGFLAGKLVSRLGLPEVTGFILAGIALNPQITGIVSPSFVNHSQLATNVTLAIITFSVGASLFIPRIRELGKSITLIAFFEAQFANLFIVLGFLFLVPILRPDMAVYAVPLALLFGALGSPTDPSATLAVAHQYRCKGPLIKTVLGVSALDDGIGMLNYSIAAAVAAVVLSHNSFSAQSIYSPLLRIGLSLLIGSSVGAVFSLLEKKMNLISTTQVLPLLLGSIYCCYGLADQTGADSLLAVMTMGFTVVNAGKWCRQIPGKLADSIEQIVFILFFTVSGMKLDFTVLKSSALLVLLFVVLRITGKFAGAGLGAKLAKAPLVVKKYTGACLVPQGGIVIGLALVLTSNPLFQPFADTLISIILGTVIINELTGPMLAKWALNKAGEIRA